MQRWESTFKWVDSLFRALWQNNLLDAFIWVILLNWPKVTAHQNNKRVTIDTFKSSTHKISYTSNIIIDVISIVITVVVIKI